MKQILVLTLFQCIVDDDFFTKTSKNVDTGANNFVGKRDLPSAIQIVLIENLVSASKNCNGTSTFLQNLFKPKKQILVLNPFQCIVSDLFTISIKIF